MTAAAQVNRVVVLGRGGAGKTTAALTLGERMGLPVIELDRLFWRSDLTPTPRQEWGRIQAALAVGERWIMDGDLGRYDLLEPRLQAADLVLVLDFSLPRCAWRAARRSRERADFWWWLFAWRLRSRRGVLASVARSAPGARCVVLRTPRALRRLLAALGPG